MTARCAPGKIPPLELKMTMQAQTCSLKDARQSILSRLGQLKSLPTTVAVAVRLFELQKHQEDPQPNDYARIIATDVGLSARLLALANSPFYGIAKRIT